MIKYTKGNILKADTEVIVNTVNCVGVMGKGIALQVKQAYPEVFKRYKHVCDDGKLKPGRMHLVKLGGFSNPRFIINFPTKRHWKQPSFLEDIKLGLPNLRLLLKKYKIKSVSIPPLGCGNGGLCWDDVRPLIVEEFQNTPMDVWVYEPIL